MPVLSEQKLDSYQSELLHTLRITNLITPIGVIVIGYLTRIGIFDSRYYVSDSLFIVIATCFLLLGIWGYVFPKIMLPLKVGYIILGSLYLLFVTGMMNPGVIFWMILATAFYVLYGFTHYLIAVMALITVTATHYVLHPGITNSELAYNVTITVLLVSTSALILRLIKAGETERIAYVKTRGKEMLQRDRMLALINSMGDAVISTNAKGVIKVYNAAALNLLDTNKTLTGQSIDSVLTLKNEDGDKQKLLPLLNGSRGIVVRRDLQLEYNDGEKANLYISASPIRPGFQQKTQQGYIFLLRDITKEKSLEDERDEFISVVSHELRTPVAITEGSLSNIQLMLERGHDPQLLIKTVHDSHEQVLYLAKMINDLSTLSRAERGVADEPEEINVTDMIHALFNEYRASAETKNLRLNVDVSIPPHTIVSASRLYLEEILQNFITNAIKYTKEGSVTIIVQSDKDRGIEFAVKDTGIGISKSDQKHVFDKFYRSEDYRTRETSGTGLGLYVVQKLASKLNTHIQIKSRLNFGTTFSFKLPAGKE